MSVPLYNYKLVAVMDNICMHVQQSHKCYHAQLTSHNSYRDQFTFISKQDQAFSNLATN